MDAFSYLSVLLSIILGLAITQVLQGYRALLLSRGRVTRYLPTYIWSALMLLFATQAWWASFGLADHTAWDFASFTVVLLQMILLYMMAAIVLPDVPAGEATDLRAHYYRERVPFFALCIVMLLSSLAKDLMIDGRLPEAGNVAFHLAFMAAAAISLATTRPRWHELQAPLIALLTGGYIAILFARLATD